MNLNKLIFALIATVFLFSCKPIYKCGEAKPEKKFFLPKIITNVIDERDSLCTTLSERDVQIGGLNAEVDSLNAKVATKTQEYAQLDLKYNELLNSSLSKTEQLNMALKQKTEELDAKSAELFDKERLLNEREGALLEMRKKIAQQDSATNKLRNTLRDALFNFKTDELSVEVKNGKIYISMSDKLLFSSGSVQVEQKGTQALQLLADVLNKNPEIDVTIEGHTDNIPIKTALYKDNWDLSVARATNILRILVNDYKVAPARLTASGKGEFTPKASNATPEGRAKNRRTEIILSPKLDEVLNLLKTN